MEATNSSTRVRAAAMASCATAGLSALAFSRRLIGRFWMETSASGATGVGGLGHSVLVFSRRVIRNLCGN